MPETLTPKPICVIRIPKSHLGGSNDIRPVIQGIQEHFDRTKPDYHWFVLPSDEDDFPDRKEVEFEVFYEKDWQPIAADELKALIQKALSNAGDK